MAEQYMGEISTRGNQRSGPGAFGLGSVHFEANVVIVLPRWIHSSLAIVASLYPQRINELSEVCLNCTLISQALRMLRRKFVASRTIVRT